MIVLFGRLLTGCTGDAPSNLDPSVPAGPVPTGDYVAGLAAVLTDNMSYGALIATEKGETLVAVTERDGQANIVGVRGAVYSVPADAPFVVRFDINGWPKHAVYAGDVIFFRDWSSDTVDVAILTSSGSELVYYDVMWNIGDSFSHALASSRQFSPYPVFGSIDYSTLEPLRVTPESGEALSPYGRSMQSYGYSVISREYHKGNMWRYTLKWTLTGANIANSAFKATGFAGVDPGICTGVLACAGEDVLDHPHLTPTYVENAGNRANEGGVQGQADQAVYFAEIETNSGQTIWSDIKAMYSDFIEDYYFNNIYETNMW